MQRAFFVFWLSFLFFFSATVSRAGDFLPEYFSAQDINDRFNKNLTLKAGSFETELSESQIREWIKEKTDLSYSREYMSEIENTHFCQYKKSMLCALTFLQKNTNHIKKISRVSLDAGLIADFLNDLARTTNTDPQNAKLQIENEKVSVFSMNQNGVRLNKEKSLQIILNYFQKNDASHELKLATDEIIPEITLDSIDKLGIKSLIGEGISNFAGSPKNRIFNIKIATSRFNGILIKPGEEFSFVKILGEVDGEHGYLPELVIKRDKTEPEFGGGICQVSTTAFRAAIMSGLEITARRNHAYPVRYYNPQGMDATVYVPKPDLRFKNNTPGYILIQTKIEGTQLIFDFFGTNDGRKISITGPKITESNPDGSMKTTFTQEVFDASGNKFINDTFNSVYDSPNKYPHPGEILTQKPSGWSNKEWKKYKKEHNL